MKSPTIALTLACLLSVFPYAARAEKGDRDKPINVEADRVSIDDLKKIQIFEGNVLMIQGTLRMQTSKLVVTQDADGFQKGVATGGADGLARFRQKRDGKDEFIEGEAERIEHNTRDEKTEFFARAWVKSGQDEVKGQYILYDALSEKYLVTNKLGEAKSATGSEQARVRAIIQPRSKTAPASDPSATSGGTPAITAASAP